ncbi:hypothetical protein HDE_06057 [Halotydeus destructor]|nr:hypothetical protein HDE_06057 [Halotydeus destructor]
MVRYKCQRKKKKACNVKKQADKDNFSGPVLNSSKSSKNAELKELSFVRLLKRKKKNSNSNSSTGLSQNRSKKVVKLERRLNQLVNTNMGRLIICAILLIIGSYLANVNADPYEDEYEPLNKKKSGEEGDGEDTDLSSDSSSPRLEPLSVRWSELSWKILCDEDEWRSQFVPIRNQLANCLQLDAILLPEEKEVDDEKKKRNWSLMFTDGPSNPYCRLSKNWLKCHTYLKAVNCLAPDVKGLMDKKQGSSMVQTLGNKLPKYPDPDEWIALHSPYKLTCMMAKSAASALAFGLSGGGLFG